QPVCSPCALLVQGVFVGYADFGSGVRLSAKGAAFPSVPSSHRKIAERYRSQKRPVSNIRSHFAMCRTGAEPGEGRPGSDYWSVISDHQPQCAISTGRLALARIWRVVPPKII